jgi:hypothetical protein
LFLSLDDLPKDESKTDPSTSTPMEEDEIIVELEEPVNREAATVGTPVEIENTHEETPVIFQEETENITDEVDLFLADEPTLVLDENASADIKNKPEETDSQELFLSLDDLPKDESKTDPSESTRIEEDEIVFELEEPINREAATAKKDAPDEKGFWDSDEIKKQEAAYGLEETHIQTTDDSPEKTTDENKDVNLFSDLDIEPLDLELSLDDIDKNP